MCFHLFFSSRFVFRCVYYSCSLACALVFYLILILFCKRTNNNTNTKKNDKERTREREILTFYSCYFLQTLSLCERKFSDCSESFGDYNIGTRSLIRIAFMREYRIYLNEIRCCCLTNPVDFCKSIPNGTKTFQNVGLKTGDKRKWFRGWCTEEKNKWICLYLYF